MTNPGSGFGNLAWNEEGQISSLDLYAPITRDLSLKGGRTICVNPISHTSSAGAFTFSLPSIPQYYINLPSLRLYLEGNITKSDRTKAPAKVSVRDNLIVSLFESLLFEVNEKKVPELSSENLQYKHYIAMCFYRHEVGEIPFIIVKNISFRNLALIWKRGCKHQLDVWAEV